MSSNTNNLRAILLELSEASWATHMRKDLKPLQDEAEAAVLALLPERKSTEVNAHMDTVTYYKNIGWDDRDDQTRRNLIGEQLGDSNSPRGDTKPLSNQVMPEAPASGKEQ